MFARSFAALALAAALVLATPAGAFFTFTTAEIVEFSNEITGHYLQLADRAEIAGVERGSAGPGWSRTGFSFHVYTGSAPDATDTNPVCRFYSPVHNSHFFTADMTECEWLKANSREWVHERIAFHIALPVRGACGSNRLPIYRLYNNRHAFNDANHRFTGSETMRAAMIAAGWVDEGLAFCAVSGGYGAEKSYELWPENRTGSLDQCEATVGRCTVVTQLPAMNNRIDAYLLPSFERNPAYPWAIVEGLTGLPGVSLDASRPPGSPDLAEHSFFQVGGWFIRGTDRLQGPYASISPMYVLPRSSAAGDERVFPWRGTRDREVVIRSMVMVRKLQRREPGAEAYSLALLHFTDQVSGRSVYVTLQQFGTGPTGDFIGRDITRGWAIVSTSFREQPAFGRRISGQYRACDGGAAPCIDHFGDFSFGIDRAAFQEILRRARGVDPALSPNASEYFLAAFRHHNETYLDAELGMALRWTIVGIYPIDQAPSAK